MQKSHDKKSTNYIRILGYASTLQYNCNASTEQKESAISYAKIFVMGSPLETLLS